MRKERQRTRRTDRQPNQPKRKKQRIEMENNIAIETLIQEMRRGEKRHPANNSKLCRAGKEKDKVRENE